MLWNQDIVETKYSICALYLERPLDNGYIVFIYVSSMSADSHLSLAFKRKRNNLPKYGFISNSVQTDMTLKMQMEDKNF